jgi:hypothetical protein
MTEAAVTYTVEAIGRPYGARERIPWADAGRVEELTEAKAIKIFHDYYRWYHPQGGDGYSGHVRILGSDRWTYTVEPPSPGERATLSREYHLDDL